MNVLSVPPAPLDPRPLEAQVAREKQAIDALDRDMRANSGDIARLEQNMANLARDMKPLQRWVGFYNITGKAAFGATIAGLASFSFQPWVGAGLFLGGLVGFEISYLLQAKKRIALSRPAGEFNTCQSEAKDLGTRNQALSAQRAVAETSMRKAQGQLDVLRMAASVSASPPAAAAVEVGGGAVKLGNVTVPRRNFA